MCANGCGLTNGLCILAGKIIYQRRSEVHGPRTAPQVQLRQPQVSGRKRDGVSASARMLRQAQPLLGGERERQRHGGDDPLQGPVSQRVSSKMHALLIC